MKTEYEKYKTKTARSILFCGFLLLLILISSGWVEDSVGLNNLQIFISMGSLIPMYFIYKKTIWEKRFSGMQAKENKMERWFEELNYDKKIEIYGSKK